jgi:hypothetical protein
MEAKQSLVSPVAPGAPAARLVFADPLKAALVIPVVGPGLWLPGALRRRQDDDDPLSAEDNPPPVQLNALHNKECLLTTVFCMQLQVAGAGRR